MNELFILCRVRSVNNPEEASHQCLPPPPRFGAEDTGFTSPEVGGELRRIESFALEPIRITPSREERDEWIGRPRVKISDLGI